MTTPTVHDGMTTQGTAGWLGPRYVLDEHEGGTTAPAPETPTKQNTTTANTSILQNGDMCSWCWRNGGRGWRPERKEDQGGYLTTLGGPALSVEGANVVVSPTQGLSAAQQATAGVHFTLAVTIAWAGGGSRWHQELWRGCGCGLRRPPAAHGGAEGTRFCTILSHPWRRCRQQCCSKRRTDE